MKPTCRVSWAGNLLMLSDLTFGPSFNVKQFLTGFGELSFWWIQICVGSPMHRSSVCLLFTRFSHKGFNKDISPVTISLWIKQTVNLCYKLSYHAALALHQVKTNDVRAFAASKAFQYP